MVLELNLDFMAYNAPTYKTSIYDTHEGDGEG